MRRCVLALVPVLAALALAACGSGSDAAVSAEGDPSNSVLAAAASNATGAGSSKVDFTVTTQVPQHEGPVTLSGEGAFDYEAGRGRLAYDLGDLFAALGQTAPGADEPVEIILDGNVFYMKFGLLSSLVPGVKPWIKFDLESLAQQEGFDLGGLQSINQGYPSQMLEYLRAAGSVEELGAEEVRGVETTHYRGVVDFDRAVELAPAELRDRVRQSIEELEESSGLTELPVEVWIDGEGRPARIQYSFDGSVAPGGEGDGFTTIVTMELYDWGTDVVVEPPPASEVSDFSELSELAGAGTGTAMPDPAAG